MPDSAPLSTARKANAVEPNVTARDVTTGSFPSSRKVHVAGRRHGDLRVAMREIDLEPSANEAALRVYDTSGPISRIDRKSTRLNSSHRCISYAVFCLKKKKNTHVN